MSLTILSCHYPMKLIKHLRDERKLSVEKISPGVYHINKETFNTQIIVTNRLLPEDNLYLRCLTDKLQDMELTDKLADDYKKHWEQEIYDRYMQHLASANRKSEGEVYMVINEWLYEMCGTSSDEVIARAKKESEEYYRPKIDSLSSDNRHLAFDNKHLASENEYLKSLLRWNNIPFNSETGTDAD